MRCGAGSIVAVLAAALAGCGGEAPSDAGKTRVAAVFATPIEEPWDGCIHQALLRAKRELGVHYEWAESVANPDFERVVREFAGRGFDLVMGDAFGSEEAVRRAAKDSPKTAFLFGSGLKPQAPTSPSSTTDPRARLPLGDDRRETHEDELHRRGGGLLGPGGEPAAERILLRRPFGESPDQAEGRLHQLLVRPAESQGGGLAQAALGADVFFGERYGVIEACREKGLLAFSNMQPQAAPPPTPS